MRRLESHPTPGALQKLQTLDARRVDAENGGDPLTDAEKAGYRDPVVKSALLQETGRKCAYCESRVTHVYWGDVEHILPKADACRPDLRYDYDNLTVACAVCNNNKRDYCENALPLINPYVDQLDGHFVWLGPMTWASPGSDRGEVTIKRLKLNRLDLVQRRQERLEAVEGLARRYLAQPDGPLKDALLEQIAEELSDEAEYTAHLRQALSSIGIPV